MSFVLFSSDQFMPSMTASEDVTFLGKNRRECRRFVGVINLFSPIVTFLRWYLVKSRRSEGITTNKPFVPVYCVTC